MINLPKKLIYEIEDSTDAVADAEKRVHHPNYRNTPCLWWNDFRDS